MLANGQPVQRQTTAQAGPNITVQATPWQAGKAVGAVFTTPYLRIRAEQRWPTLPQQKADPRFGNWLDVYLTLLAPPPLPVGGLLGAC